MKEIPLGKNGKYAIVDEDDYEYLSQWKWYCNGLGYAVRSVLKNGKHSKIFMHRTIMNTPGGMHTDHRNHQKLDNRHSNLRVCTNSQNQANGKRRIDNTSGKRGVFYDKHCNKWRAAIKYQKERIYIGYFDNIKEAADAYRDKAIELFGEFTNI